MKPHRANRFFTTLFVAAAGTGLFANSAFAGGTIVINNTGISAGSFSFMDNGWAGYTQTLGTNNGTDPDANAFGNDGRWSDTGSGDFAFTGLAANATYSVYATWYGGGPVGMVAKVGGTTVGTANQSVAPSSAGTGFTAYDDVNDSAAEPRDFQLLGTATTDGSGNLTINASRAAGYSYVRWDCFAVAPVPVLPPPGPRYWDGNAATANNTSDNTSTSAMNWFNGGNWDNGTSSVPQFGWNSGDPATFGGAMAGTQTITLAGSITTSGLTFDTAGYTITGGTITNTGSCTLTANADASINSGIAGAALIKAGNGTLTRGSATSYSSLLVSAGKLVCATGGFNALSSNTPLTVANATVSTDSTVNNANNMGAITLNGGTMTSGNGPAGPANDGGWGNWIINFPTTVGGTAASTISCTNLVLKNGDFSVADATASPATDLLIAANIANDIAATVSAITKTGPGTLELTGANTYTGNTTVNQGTLKLGATSSFGSTPTLTVATAATADVSATAGLTFDSAKTLVGGGSVIGAVTVNGGTINATGPLSVTSLSVSGSSTLNFIPGTSSLAVTATDGINTGATGNTLWVDVGTNPITSGTYHLIQYNGTIQGDDGFTAFQLGLNPGGDYTYDLVQNGNYIDLVVAPLAKLWTGALNSAWTTAVLGLPKNWKAGPNPSDFVTGDDVLFDDSAGNTVISITAANVSPNSVNFGNNTKTYTLQGGAGITGTTGLLKSGTGPLVIASSHSFTGPVTINGGTLTASSVANGGSNSPLGAGTEISFGGGALAYAGANAGTNRTVYLDGDGAVDVTTPGTTLTLSGEITGGGTFTKVGAGTLTPTFDNTYTGTTLINAGTLSLSTLPDGGLASPLGQSSNAAASLVFGGGTLRYTGATATCDRGFTLTPATTSTIAVANSSASLTLSGVVAGAGDLAKSGAGTLVRGTVMNSYTSLSVLEGKLSVNTGAYNGFSFTAPITIAAGAVLSADNTTDNAHNLGIVTLNGGTLTSINGPTGPANDGNFGNWVVDGFTVVGASPSTVSSSSLLMKTSGTGTFDVADVTGSAATDLLVSARIMEDGIYTIGAPLTKTGVGTLELTGHNSYTGNTTVNAGTLVLADNARLTFAIGNTSGVCNKLTGAGTVTLNGDFAINTSAVALTTGTWQLEDVTSLTGAYGATFTAMDPDGTVWTNAGSDKWTKTAGTQAWSFDETTGTLTLSVAAGFTSWIAGFGLAVGDQDPADDPDGDGINNLMEYALAGRNPALSDGPAGTFTGGLLSFAKRIDATGITYAIQESDDLGANDLWTAVTPTTNTATEITWQMLPVDRAKRFARLMVTKT